MMSECSSIIGEIIDACCCAKKKLVNLVEKSYSKWQFSPKLGNNGSEILKLLAIQENS